MILKRRARSRRLTAVLSLVALHAATVYATTNATTPATGIPDTPLLEATIAKAYAVASRSIDAKEPFSIRPVAYEHLSPESLRSLLVTDVLTLRDGLVLNLSRREHRGQGSEGATVRYAAEWQSAQLSELDRSQTIISALEFLERAHVATDGLTGATSVTVSIRLGGKERRYRALFLWFTASPSDNALGFRAQIVDGVANRLGDILREPPHREKTAAATAAVATALSAATGQKCVISSTTETHTSGIVQNPAAHITGYHKTRVDWSYTCTCNQDCYSTCSAGISNDNCFDNGFVTTYSHVPGSNNLTVDGTSLDGVSSPAKCNTAFGCAVRACLFSTCSTSVNISSNGVTIDIKPPTDSIWNYQHNDNPGHQCPPCMVAPPPPPTVPPGGVWITIDHQNPFPPGGIGGVGGLPRAPQGCTWVCVSPGGNCTGNTCGDN